MNVLSEYKAFKVIPGAAISVGPSPFGVEPVTKVAHIDCSIVTEALGEGWEVVQIVTHHCPKTNATGVAFVVGHCHPPSQEQSES